MFNKFAFRAAVINAGMTLGGLADILGLNPATLTIKMTGQSDFTLSEIHNIRNVLGLTPMESDKIFFADKLT